MKHCGLCLGRRSQRELLLLKTGHLAGPVQGLGQKPEVTGTPIVLQMGACSHQVGGSPPSLQDTRGKTPARRNEDDKKLNGYQPWAWESWLQGPAAPLRWELRQVQGERPPGEPGG